MCKTSLGTGTPLDLLLPIDQSKSHGQSSSRSEETDPIFYRRGYEVVF